MFQVDLENGSTPVTPEKINPPAIVQSVRADDYSISFSLRIAGEGKLESIEQGLAEFLRYEHARELLASDFAQSADLMHALRAGSGSDWVKIFDIKLSAAEREALVGTVVTGLLVEIGRELADPTLRARYGSGELTEREQLEVLRHASSQARIEFFYDLKEMHRSNSEVAVFVSRKLDNASHFLSLPENVLLAANVASNLTAKSDCDFLAQMLRSSSDFVELKALVAAVGMEKLVGANHRELLECAAQINLGSQICEIKLPPALDPTSAPDKILSTLKEIEKALSKIQEICTTEGSFNQTDTAKRFIWGAAYNLSYLQSDCAFLDWAGDAQKDLCELANVLIKKIEIERRFGILLTHEEFNGQEMSLGRRWKPEDLEGIEGVLEKIGEGRLLLTPLLHEIRRVSDLGENIMGVRFPDGRIAIADLAVGNVQFASQYGGPSSLELVLTHELGHSAQLGVYYGHIQFDPEKGWCVDEGDPIYDFAEYMKLSGWRMIDPTRYSFLGDGPIVLVDGKPLQLETPVQIDGESLVLVRSGKLLLAYAQEADFSSRWYSKVNPWEDFAEAFMEYFWAPDKLMQHAPEKFQFLEQELRFYERNPGLLEQITADSDSGERKAA